MSPWLISSQWPPPWPVRMAPSTTRICPPAWAVEVAWLAGLLSVLTAYVRCLATSTGAPADFRGPMAKPHRMALLTGACLGVAAEIALRGSDYTLAVAVVVIAAGCVVTVLGRVRAAYLALEGR